MKYAFTIHQIIMQKTTTDPGTVMKIDDEKIFAELLNMGAIREATDSEIALFGLANPSAATVPLSNPIVAMSRGDLEARAAIVGVEFRANISDAKLLERILEAEGQDAAGDRDVTVNPLLT